MSSLREFDTDAKKGPNAIFENLHLQNCRHLRWRPPRDGGAKNHALRMEKQKSRLSENINFYA